MSRKTIEKIAINFFTKKLFSKNINLTTQKRKLSYSKLSISLFFSAVATNLEFKEHPSHFIEEEKFNLREKIPSAEDAKRVFLENPETVFIGIYNDKTKGINFRPAMQPYLYVTYDDKGEIIAAKDDCRLLSQEELKALKENFKLFIPRKAFIPGSYPGRYYTSHVVVLNSMNVQDSDRGYLYGFTATLKKNGQIDFSWQSGINLDKINSEGCKYMPFIFQEEVKKIINSWLIIKTEEQVLSFPSLTR